MFTGLRTSALCGRNIWLFLLVSGLSAVPFIVNTASKNLATIIVRNTHVRRQVEFFKSKLLFVVTSPDNICETFVTWNSKLILGYVLVYLARVIICPLLIIPHIDVSTTLVVSETVQCLLLSISI